MLSEQGGGGNGRDACGEDVFDYVDAKLEIFEREMAEYYYRLRNESFPEKQLFACGFEFGTFGDSLLARIRSLRAMVYENQLHWHGAKNERIAEKVRKEFQELYFPEETKWHEKAIQDCRLAFEGILSAYGLLKGATNESLEQNHSRHRR